MEREVHRLEKLILTKEQTIKSLTATNKQLEGQLSTARKQIQQMKEKAISNFSYRHVPDREIIHTLEAKVAASAWQILQLQKINMKYEETIVRLQSDILTSQQEVNMSRCQYLERTDASDNSNMSQAEINNIFKEWEQVLRQKEGLIHQNLKLKEEAKGKQAQIAEKMSFYLNEVESLGAKIRNQYQNQKSKLGQFQSLLKQLKKQNQSLRQALAKKNQQVLMFYQETKTITTTKAEDLHTIRNLRAELKKKSEQYYKILSKLKETQQLKVKLIQYNTQCSECLGQFNRLSQKYQQTKRQNGILKQKLLTEQTKTKTTTTTLQQTNKKLYQLLIENEACHELLYETRGYSNLFTKDIEAKVERFLLTLEKRRENCDTWLDVSQLIAVNQKFRSRGFRDYEGL